MRHDIHNSRCLTWSPRQSAWSWPDDRTCFFASGREALIALLKALRLPTGTTVLLPSFCPEGIVAPMQRCRMRVLMYRLDRYLNPDWHHLEDLVSHQRPKLAVLIHYFGLAKPIETFCEICHRHGILVIEDLAHVLPVNDCVLGRTGDFVLFSLPKLVGVPDGGPLLLRTDTCRMADLQFRPHRLHRRYVRQQLAILVTNTLSRKLPFPYLCRTVRRGVFKLANSYHTLMEYFESPNPMSRISQWLLRHIDAEQCARRMREHARHYDATLDPSTFERFPGMNGYGHGVFGFPVLVRNRAALIEWLEANGIQGTVFGKDWDFIPDAERPFHAECIDTIQDHFIFPTAYHLRSEEIAYIVKVANEWAHRAASRTVCPPLCTPS